MATVTLDGTVYDSADLADGGHRDATVGFFAILTAMVAELNGAGTAQGISPGAIGGLLGSDGSEWTRTGFLRLASVTSITPGSQQDNLAIGDYAVVRATPSAAFDLTGLASPVAGRALTIVNLSDTYAITVKHESASSTAANRFDLEGDADKEIGTGQASTFWYDTTSSRWRLIATVGGGASFTGCKLYRSSAQTIVTGTPTYVIWNAEEEDTDGFWSSGDAATVPAGKGGVYGIMSAVNYGPATNGSREAYLELNGTTRLVNAYSSHNDGNSEAYLPMSTIQRLAVGDDVRVKLTHGRGSDLTTQAGVEDCYLILYKIGD